MYLDKGVIYYLTTETVIFMCEDIMFLCEDIMFLCESLSVFWLVFMW